MFVLLPCSVRALFTLMLDIDRSASIAYKHCHDGRRGYLPLTIVTASVDRMDLLNPLRPDLDLKLHGHVTYVGRSSMEGMSHVREF